VDLAVGGVANRQIARALACAPSTIDGLLARLDRRDRSFRRHLAHEASPLGDGV
jgi:DNA-binding CsgD family transcriptional regulator